MAQSKREVTDKSNTVVGAQRVLSERLSVKSLCMQNDTFINYWGGHLMRFDQLLECNRHFVHCDRQGERGLCESDVRYEDVFSLPF